jgi:regulator of nucleoside diphosphate kinase
MALATKRNRRSAITLTRSDSERHWRLAESYASRNCEVAEVLVAELERVTDVRIATDAVRMRSTLRFTSDIGEDRRVIPVLPGDADIAEGKVSILMPIGAAVIAGASNRRDGTRRAHSQSDCGICGATRMLLVGNDTGRTADCVRKGFRPPCRLSLFGGCLIAGS